MMRLIGLCVATALAAIAFYVSRFWELRLWGRGGLFDIEVLRPQGDLVAFWLRGTDFNPFSTLIWGIGVFVALSLVQKLFNFFDTPPKD